MENLHTNTYHTTQGSPRRNFQEVQNKTKQGLEYHQAELAQASVTTQTPWPAPEGWDAQSQGTRPTLEQFSF